MTIDQKVTGQKIEAMVAKVGDIFATHGAEEYLGEDVTMAEHMLQSAHLAEQDGCDELVVTAAFLHDIGHFTSAFGAFSMEDTKDKYHETAGAELLGDFFPDEIVACVEHHVAAKRYLCGVDQEYYAALSEASKHSLSLQGGAMDANEIATFAKHPHLQSIITVRRCDDRGKIKGMETPPVSHFLGIMENVLKDYHQSATGV